MVTRFSIHGRLIDFILNSFRAMPFYAVRCGFKPGIYSTWPECQTQVNHFPGARYKKFPTRSLAEEFVKGVDAGAPTVSTVPGVAGRRASKMKSVNGSTWRSNGGGAVGAAATSAPVDGGALKSTVARLRCDLKRLKKEVKVLHACTQLSSASAGATGPTTATTGGRGNGGIDGGAAGGGGGNNNNVSGFQIGSDGFLEVWTDGACSMNGRRGSRAGVGVWFGADHPLNVSAPVVGAATNNNAEIQAAWQAIEVAAAAGHQRVRVYTDSQFLISCVTRWLPGWRRNGWKLASGGDVKNREQLERLLVAMEGVAVKWEYVPGHAGVVGNEGADRLAVAGARKYRLSTD